MRTRLLYVALVLVPAGLASAGGLGKLLETTVNRLMIVILPPSESDPSNIALVDGDMMRGAMMDQPAAAMIHAREAHETATGSSVLVAVLDAGFDLSHPVLEDRVSPDGYDTLDRDNDPNDLGNGYDDYGEGTPDNAVGHGNFVAGMVLLAAPDATFLPIRVMDDEGYGNNRALADGIRLALQRGARVINISGRAGLLGAWDVRSALDEAKTRGVLVVASAGNEGKAGLGVVAGDPRTVSVGAVDDDFVVAPFSNSAGWGEELTVYAPGVDLKGPMAEGAMGTWSGTSFSAGLASGAAALWLELEPSSSPDAVRERIRACVNPAFDRDGDPCEAGVIDLLQVVTR
jgi:hypothetical protein